VTLELSSLLIENRQTDNVVNWEGERYRQTSRKTTLLASADSSVVVISHYRETELPGFVTVGKRSAVSIVDTWGPIYKISYDLS